MVEDYPKHDYVMELAGLDKVCKWSLAKPDQHNPHVLETRDHTMKIKNSILDCVGNTPLIRINNITKTENIECELLVKAEFLNPGGSVKDRIGRRMIMDAESRGTIKKGDILIEPTSGNTGVGLSMAAAARGYRMIITMPEKMSQEKSDALKGLGATVIRTPTSYPFDHRYCHIGIAIDLSRTLENAHCLDQYKATGNPMSHYQETGREIWEQTEGNVDYVVAGTGTGGTISGIARYLKEKNPNIKIIGVDPNGSILAQPESLNDANQPAEGGQQVEGIGYDFLPRVFDRTVIDHWIKAPDKPSYLWARRLMREEGLMCGGSSGTAFWAAVEYIKEHKIGAGKRVVVILPDNIRNYMTKHLNDDWMYERGYITEEQCAQAAKSDLVPNTDWGQKLTVADLDLPDAIFLQETTTIGEAMERFQTLGFAQYPVKDATGKVTGAITKTKAMEQLVKVRVTLDDPISKLVDRALRNVSLTVSLDEMGRVLVRNKFALVNKTKFITQSDLLKKLTPVPVEAVPVEAEAKSSARGSMMTMAATTVAGMGVAAIGTFLFMKKQQ